MAVQCQVPKQNFVVVLASTCKRLHRLVREIQINTSTAVELSAINKWMKIQMRITITYFLEGKSKDKKQNIVI